MNDYLLIPFLNEFRNVFEHDYGIVAEPDLKEGRLPTPAEIRSVIKRENGFEVEHRFGEGSWQIDYYKNRYKQAGFYRYDDGLRFTFMATAVS